PPALRHLALALVARDPRRLEPPLLGRHLRSLAVGVPAPRRPLAARLDRPPGGRVLSCLRRGVSPGQRSRLLARGPSPARPGRRQRGAADDHAARATDVRPRARRAGAPPDPPPLPSVLLAPPGLA